MKRGRVCTLLDSTCLGIILLGSSILIPLAACGEGIESKHDLPRSGDFTLKGVNGDPFTPENLSDHEIVVVFFIDIHCPLSNGYAPEMMRIKERYAEQGVGFYGVYPDPALDPENAMSHGREYRLGFPLSLDPEQILARQLGITIVPEVAVLDSSGQLKYRGRIDNWYSTDGRRRTQATRHDLRDALDSLLAGKDPDPAFTDAYGCFLPEPVVPADR